MGLQLEQSGMDINIGVYKVGGLGVPQVELSGVVISHQLVQNLAVLVEAFCH